MKKTLLLFCLFICSNTKAQLVLEGILTTGMNMTIQRQDFHPESPLHSFTFAEDFAGINVGGNVGLRLFFNNFLDKIYYRRHDMPYFIENRINLIVSLLYKSG